MKQCVWMVLLGVVLPLVTSFVTYTVVSLGSKPIMVDETGALIIMLTLLKLVLLSTQGIFPIDLNALFNSIINKGKRSTTALRASNNRTLYEVPEVDETPCIRRFLCELETVVRTSDNYLPEEPTEAINDRILEEEFDPEVVDPISEMQAEAIRALYREGDPTGELSERGRRALGVVESLTGQACELAYRLCPGRYKPLLVYRTIFDEINMIVHDND